MRIPRRYATNVGWLFAELPWPDRFAAARAAGLLMLERLGRLGWRLQLDTYHLGRTESGVAAALRRAGPWLGHLQVADLLGRHEPGTGIIEWRAVGGALRDIGYEGAIGLEYAPSPATRASRIS